jgi:dehydrogenase/reductase SDR family member 7B
VKKNIFKNKVIWITGASSGIGEALTYAFHEQSANLIISARNIRRLEKVKNNCTKTNSDVHVLPLDLSDLESINIKVEIALKYYGKIDYMIHNAGIALRDLAINTDLRVDQTIMAINYFGPIAITKLILPTMIRNKTGNFVVISSLSGKYGIPNLSAYAASKHALHGFFDSLRSEVHKDNIKITIIIPGIIKTDITLNALKGDGTKYGKMEKVQERGIIPEACAHKILDAISRGKEEALIGGPEIFTAYIRRYFPAIFSRMIRNHPIKRLNKIVNMFNLKNIYIT